MQYTHSYDDIEFLIRTSTPEQIAVKFGLQDSVEKIASLIADPDGLAQFLLSSIPVPEEQTDAPVGIPEVVFETRRVDYGYLTQPRGKYVFIRPVPQDHPARIVFPKSHQSDQEVGFIHAVNSESVPDLHAGDLVVFDRFCAIGAAFDVVDESGEPCFVLQVDEVAVSAVLHRREL